jgi:hypothetical protein
MYIRKEDIEATHRVDWYLQRLKQKNNFKIHVY